jgi:hypothetical protein
VQPLVIQVDDKKLMKGTDEVSIFIGSGDGETVSAE